MSRVPSWAGRVRPRVGPQNEALQQTKPAITTNRAVFAAERRCSPDHRGRLAWIVPTAVALAGVLALAPSVASAMQAQLIPVDPALSEFGPLADYHLAVRDRLLGHEPSARYALVFSSFHEEWALALAHDRGAPLVLYAVPKSAISGAFQNLLETGSSQAEALRTLTVPVTLRSAPLSLDTMQVVERSWSAILSAARHPSENRRVIDGTGILVFGPNAQGKAVAGVARSPIGGTPAHALVDLVDTLRRHVLTSEAGRRETDSDIRRLAGDLLSALQE